MILFVYPVVGATIHLGIQARERRLNINPIPATVPVEHADHGRWMTAGVLVAVLIAMSHDVVADVWLNIDATFSKVRVVAFFAAELGVIATFLGLLKSHRTLPRLGWGLSCWMGLLMIGSQLDVVAVSDSPFRIEFWQSHYWGGVFLVGFLILSVGLRAEIIRRPPIRALHVLISFVVALLLAMQAISGTRNLLS